MAILTFRVKGQTLTVESKINKIVENSVNYLDYEIIYDDEKWDPPLAKKVVVTYDKKTYEIFGDKIPSQVIHAPGFTVSVIGYKSDSEDDSGIIITTYPVAIKVFPSGAIKGTIPEDTAIDLSVAEQLNEKIEIQVNDIKNNYLSKDLLRILINKNSTNLEVPTAKAVYNCVEALKTEIMGDLDEISDLVGGEDSGTGELIADIGNIELVYIEEESCYKGIFTLPENSIEPSKLYIINIDGKEYKSGSLGAQGEFYISNDAREESMIMISKQEDVWTIAIYSANDFSGVHNIKIYKNPNEKKPYQILVGSRTDTGTGGSGMVYFYTDDFDADSYNLEIKDEEGTFNFDRYRYLDNTAFGFKSCDKAYSDASLKQVYLAIADGKKVSFIVTEEKDGIETTKTYILGTPDFEFTNQDTPRHYYCYGENFIPYADYPS